MPRLDLEGDARSRGLSHGEALREDIAATIDIYRGLFDLEEATVRERAAGFAAVVHGWQPELATEIEAIALGADQPAHWLHALNARSEFVSRRPGPGECTALWLEESRLLGQNWDWLQRLAPLTRLLHITHPDGHRVLTVTEPGIVGKIGLSSAGLGVCLNFLHRDRPLDGVPVHVLLRGLLDARDRTAAEQLLATAGAGRSAHVLLGDAAGGGVGLEFTGEHAHRLEPENGRVVHTNHFLAEAIDAGPGEPNSRARLDRACRRGTQLDGTAVDWRDLADVLSDRDDPDHPVCVSWRTMPGWTGGPMGTVCAVVMELGTGELHLRPGPDPDQPWSHHRLDEGATRAWH
ncbi:MAG: C45 family peptidase [Gammaproteobacteria bacterium]|nr:C45 family peptidase [Gammaproteobacteria bacterium]